MSMLTVVPMTASTRRSPGATADAHPTPAWSSAAWSDWV